MKTLKDLRKEIDSALKGKVKEAVEAFQSQREKDFEELASLNEDLEKYQNQKKDLLKTQGEESLKFIPNSKILNDSTLKMNHVEKLIRETQKEIDALFLKLSKLPDSFNEVFKFMKLIQG